MPDLYYSSMDEVPEGLREAAKEQNGKVIVKVVAQSKLDEFRENNIALARQRDDLETFKKQFGPVIGDRKVDDFLAEIKELQKTAQLVADGKLSTNDDIAKQVEERTAAMRRDYEEALKTANGEKSTLAARLEEADQKYRRTLVDRAVTDAVLAQTSKARPEALPDILQRAYGIFQVQTDGSLVPKKGEATLYGTDGTKPMTPAEWLESLRHDAPYFFKDSAGGGATAGQERTYGGLSKTEYEKLSPVEKLKIINRRAAS